MQCADDQFVVATDYIFTYHTDHHNIPSSEITINENKNMKTDRSLNKLEKGKKGLPGFVLLTQHPCQLNCQALDDLRQ